MTSTPDETTTPARDFASHVRSILAGRCDPAIVEHVVSIVAGLERALHRQARDEIEIELRLSDLEEQVIEFLRKFEDR